MEPTTPDRRLRAFLARRLATIDLVRDALRTALEDLDRGTGSQVQVNVLRGHLAVLEADLPPIVVEAEVVVPTTRALPQVDLS
jgi:hypothetical protein